MTEREWNAECRVMGLLDTSIIGRKTVVTDVREPALGYTSKDGIIHVAKNHQLYEQVSKSEARIMRMGVNIHEAMHQVFTNFDATQEKLEAIDSPQKKEFFMTIANLIEDPAIENFADQVVGGPALDAMYFTIDRCYDLASPISEHDGMVPNRIPLYEYTTALIHFGDGGLIKGEFTSSAARRCFNKTAKLIYQAINEPNGAKRMEIAMKVYEIALATLPPLSNWDIHECMEAVAKDTGKRQTEGEGSGQNANEASETQDSRNQKRRQAIRQVEEEEQEELRKDAEQIAGSREQGNAQESTDEAAVGKNEENDKEAGRGSDSCAHDESADTATAGAEQKEGENQSTHSESENIRENRQSDSEDAYRKWAEDLEAQIEKLFADYEKDHICSISTDRGVDTDATATQVAVNHPQFSEVKVSDVIPNGRYAERYKVLQDYSAKIYEPLITQLKKIFADDREQKIYTQSGAVSMKRTVSGRLTTRIFERKRLPADKADMCLMLLVDCSGSMRGDKTTAAAVTACALAETMAFFHIPTYCMGFHMCAASCVEQIHFIQWSNTNGERETLAEINANSNNFDSYSIRYATELLRARREKHKLMNIISDGLPSAYFSEQEGIKQNTLAIEDARAEKIHVFGTAIGRQNDQAFTKMYGKEFYLHVEDFNQLADQTAEMIKHIVKGW